MQQKDYILKEIEKIGTILVTIRQRILGGKDNLSINIQKELEDAKARLSEDLEFDLEQFLILNREESDKYLSQFTGFNTENMEHLAAYLSEVGFNESSEKADVYLRKALQIYQLINLKTKTYSFEREHQTSLINSFIFK